MLTAQRDGLRFEIVTDEPEVGVYLYVYDAEKCIRDILQNDVQTCIEIASEDYQVPREDWQKTGTF